MTPEIILTIGFVAAISVVLEVLPLLRRTRNLDQLKKAAHEARVRAHEAAKRHEEARKKLAESRAGYENCLRDTVKQRQDLANKLLTVSNAEKAELQKQIRTIEESLDFFKQQLEKERNRLIVSLNKNSADQTMLEYGAKNNSTEAERMALELFEAANDKELLWTERLLAIIASTSAT